MQILGAVPFVPSVFFLSLYCFPIAFIFCSMMITSLPPSHQDIFLIPVLPSLCSIYSLVFFPPFLNILSLSLSIVHPIAKARNNWLVCINLCGPFSWSFVNKVRILIHSILFFILAHGFWKWHLGV